MHNIQRLTTHDINHPDHTPRVPEIIMGVADVVISIAVAWTLLDYGSKGLFSRQETQAT